MQSNIFLNMKTSCFVITDRWLERFWSITPGSMASGVTNYGLVVEIGDDNFLDLSNFYATEEPRNN